MRGRDVIFFDSVISLIYRNASLRGKWTRTDSLPSFTDKPSLLRSRFVSLILHRIASKPSLVKSVRTGTSVLTIVSRFLFDLIWFRTSSQRLLEEWIVEYRGQVVAGYLRRDCLSDERVYLPCFTLF